MAIRQRCPWYIAVHGYAVTGVVEQARHIYRKFYRPGAQKLEHLPFVLPDALNQVDRRHTAANLHRVVPKRPRTATRHLQTEIEVVVSTADWTSFVSKALHGVGELTE
jgi:hypothetical protein